MPRFEVVSAYKDLGIKLPERSTAQSAGYDFCAAEDVFIPAYENLVQEMRGIQKTLTDAQELNKTLGIKPTLIPTGIKCYLDENQYLQLSIRSSVALKNLLILANGVGIIDADYVDNPDNEGHIMFQVLNLSPFNLLIKKGDKIGQGIILPYAKVENDNAEGERNGGFGSTGN